MNKPFFLLLNLPLLFLGLGSGFAAELDDAIQGAVIQQHNREVREGTFQVQKQQQRNAAETSASRGLASEKSTKNGESRKQKNRKAIHNAALHRGEGDQNYRPQDGHGNAASSSRQQAAAASSPITRVAAPIRQPERVAGPIINKPKPTPTPVHH